MLFEKIVLWNSLFHISIYDAVSQLNDRAKKRHHIQIGTVKNYLSTESCCYESYHKIQEEPLIITTIEKKLKQQLDIYHVDFQTNLLILPMSQYFNVMVDFSCKKCFLDDTYIQIVVNKF